MNRVFVTVLMLFWTLPVVSQPVTLGGVVRDTVSLAPLDSVRIDIVNTIDPQERYTVFTDPQGVWSYTFTGSAVNDVALPSIFSLDQNFPNPFNPSTNIQFSIHREGIVTIRVHNILGQQIDAKTFELSPGGYTIPWVSKGAAGVLFYSVEMGEQRHTKAMVQLDGGDGGGLGDPRLTRPISHSPPAAPPASTEYTITASTLGYEPDSTVVPFINNMNIDFRLQTVHRRAVVFDLHNDVMELAVNGYQLGVRHTTNHSDLPRFRDGGVDAQMLSIWANPNQFPTTAYQRAIQMMDSFSVQAVRYSDQMAQSRSSSEVGQAMASGKLAAVLCVEGGHAIQNDIAKLITFYERGARYMTITWNNSTSWAISAADPQSATVGLSEFGRQVIRTMDSLGMIIDVSHVGIRTIEDILQVTTHPIVASHSGARALRNHYRNLTDAQLLSIAQGGGVVGVVFYPPFLSSSSYATIDTVIRHIDYIKNLVGIDHVALGSDFDGIEVTPVGLENVTRFPDLTMALLRRGYSNVEVRKLLGGNYLRVFSEVCDGGSSLRQNKTN